MNKKMQAFQEFLTMQSIQVPLWGFLANLLLAVFLGWVLSQVYVRYGTSLSNRSLFAKNFVLLAVTTTLVISIVKSSLALSLGLVGALSIVRFRAAIKEPEELVYLFLTIAIGLGLGADQRVVTVAAFGLIVVVMWLRNLKRDAADPQNLFLTIAGPNSATLDDLTAILKKYCTYVNLRRLEESAERVEASFLVEYEDFSRLQSCKNDLRGLDPRLQVVFLNNKDLS